MGRSSACQSRPTLWLLSWDGPSDRSRPSGHISLWSDSIVPVSLECEACNKALPPSAIILTPASEGATAGINGGKLSTKSNLFDFFCKKKLRELPTAIEP